MKDVLVERLRENLVYLGWQVYLRILKFRNVIRHHSVFKIGKNHWLQDAHFWILEFAHAFVNQLSDFLVWSLLSWWNILDIWFTFVQTFDQLVEIFEHNFSVAQYLLAWLHFFDRFSIQVSFILDNCHCIMMILSKEHQIKSCSIVIINVKFEGHFWKQRALQHEGWMQIQYLKLNMMIR